MSLAARLRARRLALGLLQAQVAGAAGIDPSMLSLIESGTRTPSIAVLTRLCGVLRLRLDLTPIDDDVAAEGDAEGDQLSLGAA